MIPNRIHPMTAAPEVREALVVQPGDTLIVRLAANNVTMERVVQIKRELLARLPLLADVLVITCDEIAVYRPNVASEATP